MSLLKSILENPEEEEAYILTQSLRPLVLSGRHLAFVLAAKEIQRPRRSRPTPRQLSRRLAFRFAGTLVLSGPIFSVFFCGGSFLDPPALRLVRL